MLQLQVTTALSRIHTHYNSLQHALSLLSFCVHALTGRRLSHNQPISGLFLLKARTTQKTPLTNVLLLHHVAVTCTSQRTPLPSCSFGVCQESTADNTQQRSLFMEPLPSNGCCIAAYVAVATQQWVCTPQYVYQRDTIFRIFIRVISQLYYVNLKINFLNYKSKSSLCPKIIIHDGVQIRSDTGFFHTKNVNLYHIKATMACVSNAHSTGYVVVPVPLPLPAACQKQWQVTHK